MAVVASRTGSGTPTVMPLRPRSIAAIIVLFALCLVGARGFRGLPGLGGLLAPVSGVWSAAGTAELPDSAAAQIPGLAQPVTVLYDDRAVPHIFAASEADAYRALGYAVARDRLFQLEVQTRAAAGRLTEILGPAALGADQQMRRLGLPAAAERKLAALPAESESAIIGEAYAAGVNAYISSLTPDEYPLEYRVLGTSPMRWEPINSIHLFNRMGYILATSSDEIRRERAAALVGREAALALFPTNSPVQIPIQPNGRGIPDVTVPPLPPPGSPDPESRLAVAALPPHIPSLSGTTATDPGEALGSNNWAVAPSRSASGYALLAGDPHLELTLPSIWYEAHLVVPGRLDVYGVTIPGAPAMIIGFNRDAAWTMTNTQSDVLDYWIETVDDTMSPSAYRLDGEWRPLTVRVEEYRDKDGALLAVDTVRSSHRGPLRRVGGQWLSMRWTVLDPGVETNRFLAAARAASAPELLDAMASFRAPAQNVLTADRAGNIAIRSTGAYPVRANGGSGAELHDGGSSANDWMEFWPLSAYPQSLNPAQGFLASANQQPVDPAANSQYLGADWFAPWRALRINALLAADSSVTPDDMRRFQTDPGSARADAFVPAIIAAAEGSTTDSVRRAVALLGEWSRTYRIDDQRAILFEYVMDELEEAVWDEIAGDPEEGRRGPGIPGDLALLAVLRDSASAWWDRRDTPAPEGRREIIARSLTRALSRAVRDHGEPDAGGWGWSDVRRANIRHLLRIPAWSAEGVPTQGGPSTLSPMSGGGTHGPSWRMVVEFGPEVRAWGIYPGGQSGNPASSRYRDRLDRWSRGELDTLRVPATPDALPAGRVSSRLTLTRGSR